jgi:hypothetical protein
MHGRKDKFVPLGHGKWLTAHIPGAQARLLEHHGRLILLHYRIPRGARLAVRTALTLSARRHGTRGP